ncbi:hypothetical protein [Lactococcus lactis]|uniref:hypothetical protein n=1 Tax=Lactococcus lactis TaxID=1358 RepID=UPI00300E48EF
MTIVASNSLTISNVNDGTITHTAYSWSADGTDRFTTVYPNLNLLNFKSGFTFGKYLDWPTGMLIVNNIQRGTFGYVPVTPNAKYTLSANWKNGSSFSLFGFNSNADSSATTIFSGVSNTWIPLSNSGQYITKNTTVTIPSGINFIRMSWISTETLTLQNLLDAKPKLELGTTATTWMPSASEVTTADWPSYIGQYSDFTSTASTDPTKYAPWTVFKGNDGKDGVNGKDGIAGKDGVGIKTTVITYAISTSGTTAPTTGWTSSVPSLVKGQYLWTKTVWTYTDNSSETGYSVTYIAKDGNDGNDGIAGKDGTGIKTTTITYAGSTSGTTAPTSGWTSTVPTVAAGSYLWTKTVWAYTDNTSETGYSVAKMGNNGATGPQGPPGSNGDPGKVVSDTEPTTRFKGLTWKYSGTTDLTASDGTVILSGTEYYWSGTNWILNEINAHNINGNNLKITDGEFVSTTTNGPVTTSTEIKDNHIAISKTDGTVNTRNDIALDSEQGLAQKFTNINTGFYRTAGINYQGPFTSDSDGNYAQLTPQGTKLSTDVPWTTLSPMGGFSGGLIRFAVKNGVAHFSLAGLSCPPMTAGNWIKCAQLPSGSIAIPSENQVTAAFTNATVWGFYVSKSGGLYLQSTSNSPALNGFVNASNSYPIG